MNCRSNHAHAVISANTTPKIMRAQLKAWCSQRLNKFERQRSDAAIGPIDWWADRGSIRWIFEDDGLEATTLYVRDEQDNPNRYWG
jgi:hypothetical protein